MKNIHYDTIINIIDNDQITCNLALPQIAVFTKENANGGILQIKVETLGKKIAHQGEIISLEEVFKKSENCKIEYTYTDGKGTISDKFLMMDFEDADFPDWF